MVSSLKTPRTRRLEKAAPSSKDHARVGGEAAGDTAMVLTPLEHWRYAEDGDGACQAAVLRLTIGGGLDRALLAEALADALTQHPLLTARINGPASAPTAKLTWQALPPAQWPKPQWLGAGEEPPMPAIDPTHVAPLLVWAREDADGLVVWMSAHPAASDASGLTQLAYDLLQCAALGSGAGMALGRGAMRRDAGRLARRSELHLSPAEWNARLLSDLGAAWHWMRGPADPLAAAAVSAAGGRRTASLAHAVPCAWLYNFDEHQTANIERGARYGGYRLIELCQREFLATLADAVRGTAHKEGTKLRMGCAVDLRLLGDEAMPAAPLSSWLPVELDLAAYASAEEVADQAMEHYRRALDAGDALAPMHLARLFGRFPGGMVRLTHAPLARGGWGSAACFSLDPTLAVGYAHCDGRARWRAGPFELRDLRLLPALHPTTPLALAVTPYAGALNIVLRHDPESMTAVRANALLATFVARLNDAMLGAEAAERAFEELLADAAAHRPSAPLWSLPLGKRMPTCHTELAALPPAEPRPPASSLQSLE